MNKMKWTALLVSALVFVAFVPGVLVTLPPGGGKWMVLAVHGALFALLHAMAQRQLMGLL